MMKAIQRNQALSMIALLCLGACQSPAVGMSPQELSSLSNEQLCSLQLSYPWEQKTEMEIGRRNLNCDPAFNQCLGQGHQPSSPGMTSCINQVRENWRLQKQVEDQQRQMQYQQIQMQNQQMMRPCSVTQMTGPKGTMYTRNCN